MATMTEEKSVVTTKIPGSNWLDVEVQFSGKEARLVRAKWASGSIEIPVDVLHRIQTSVLGSRSAVADNRGICSLHGFYEGCGWMECSTCANEKRALTAPEVPQKLLNDTSTDRAGGIAF
jgi:hypothetical protein